MNARTRIAALASLSALALAGLSACGSDNATDPASADGSATQAAEPDESGDPSEAGSEDAGKTTVPVYFIGDTPTGPRLYREFRQVESDNPAQEALALMTAGDALDPDYSSLFPSDGATFTSVEVGDDTITVGLPDESWTTAPDGMTDDDARLAAQQLVYTLQGVAQKRLPVSITLDGAPADLFGLAGEVSNDPEIEIRALVNITSPEEGATVGDTFTASGVSSSFEATTPWEVRQGDTVVKEGFATAEGWMDKLFPWETEVDVSDLPAGEYTFVASTDDASDGEGGGPMVDTKTITIK